MMRPNVKQWYGQTEWHTPPFIHVAPLKPGCKVVIVSHCAKWPSSSAERETNEVCCCLRNGLVTFLVMLSNMSIGDLVVFVCNDSLVAGRRHFIQWPWFSFHLCVNREIGHYVVSSTFFPPLWQCVQQFLYKGQNTFKSMSSTNENSKSDEGSTVWSCNLCGVSKWNLFQILLPRSH